MTSLLSKVKSRLFIRSRRHAFHQLDGQYSSQARGRGTDFDDLREYAVGDDVRDIDWKATARSNTTLLRRFHPERRHVMTFVVDSGRSMSAVTRERESKSDLLISVVGSLAYLATRHGDDAAMLYRGALAVERIAPGRSDSHLERMLRAVQAATTRTAPAGDLARILGQAAKTMRRRGLVVCVSDEAAIAPESIDALRALRTRHDVYWVSVGDAVFGGRGDRVSTVVDVASGWSVPAFLLAGKDAVGTAVRARAERRHTNAQVLEGLGIVHTTIQSEGELLPSLVTLMSKSGRTRG